VFQILQTAGTVADKRIASCGDHPLLVIAF
jgi:hypothetical protein